MGRAGQGRAGLGWVGPGLAWLGSVGPNKAGQGWAVCKNGSLRHCSPESYTVLMTKQGRAGKRTLAKGQEWAGLGRAYW